MSKKTFANLTHKEIERLSTALFVYEMRQERLDHPAGSFDNAGRWWPDDDEQCACCDYVRTPSRRWPYSYLKHCRSIEHVANLYKVDVALLRRFSNLANKIRDNVRDDAGELEKIVKRFRVSERETVLRIAQRYGAHSAVAELKESMLARKSNSGSLTNEEAVAAL